jgi:hypothetical protein
LVYDLPSDGGALRMRAQSFSEVSGMSTCVTPKGANASITAFATAGVDAIVPVSPAPLTPNGFTGVGVTVRAVSKLGN